jgi:hypothetical protein
MTPLVKPLALAALMLALVSTSITIRAETLAAAGSVEALFTPWDDAEGAIIRALAEAQQSIHVQTYLLTSRSHKPGADFCQEARRRRGYSG